MSIQPAPRPVAHIVRTWWDQDADTTGYTITCPLSADDHDKACALFQACGHDVVDEHDSLDCEHSATGTHTTCVGPYDDIYFRPVPGCWVRNCESAADAVHDNVTGRHGHGAFVVAWYCGTWEDDLEFSVLATLDQPLCQAPVPDDAIYEPYRRTLACGADAVAGSRYCLDHVDSGDRDGEYR
jgi:hypothetical protein